MRKDRGRWIALAAAVPVGVVLGFFFVMAPLFTDSPSSLLHPERLVSFALSFGVFLVAATSLCWVSRGDWWTLVALLAPGIAIALWYSSRETDVVVLAALYVALVVAAGLAGRWAALRLRGGASPLDDQPKGSA